jgi:hypothetical protein
VGGSDFDKCRESGRDRTRHKAQHNGGAKRNNSVLSAQNFSDLAPPTTVIPAKAGIECAMISTAAALSEPTP